MAFNCRPATYTTSCSWNDGWCRLTIESISSLDGRPARMPLARRRGCSIHVHDAKVDLFVTQKLQLLAWGTAAGGGASSAGAIVMGEVEPARSSFHSDYRFNILRGFTGIGADSTPCCAVMINLYIIAPRTPRIVFRYIQDQLVAALHGAAARAVFLGHEVIRASVKVELVTVVPYDGRNPLHHRAASLWTPCQLEVATGPVFDMDAPAKPSRGTCAACRGEVKVGSMLGEGPCGHTFHHACIRRRVKESGNCPVCNATIRRIDVKLSMFLACPGPLPLTSSSYEGDHRFYPSSTRA